MNDLKFRKILICFTLLCFCPPFQYLQAQSSSEKEAAEKQACQKQPAKSNTTSAPCVRRLCCWSPCEAAPANNGGPQAIVVQQPEHQQESSKSWFKDIAPVLQTLLWVLLIAIVLISWRTELTRLLNEGRLKVKVPGVEVEVLPPEQLTSPNELSDPVEIEY